MASSAKAAPFPADPPTLEELAERTRQSAPPPAPKEERAEPYDALMEVYDPKDLRYPFDSILPATLDAYALDERTPAVPFELVNGRSSSFGFIVEPRRARVSHLIAAAGLAVLALFAIAAPRVRWAAPSSRAELEPHRMTPAQAASWAAAPFTVDVPTESSAEPDRVTAPAVREAPPPTHFDVEAAAVALSEVKSSLSECESADEAAIPLNTRVAVTFSPKGNVTEAEIDPPAEVGDLPDCIVKRLRAVHVAAFLGPSMTVRTTVTFFPRAARAERTTGANP
jgi:hypothetical protein